jgi:orotidine-5'-phosphate decarboxylase
MTKQELINNIRRKKSFLCIGLDPDVQKLPPCVKGDIFLFNKAIIDATAHLCVAYKPNLAFYESQGLQGWQAYERTIHYIKEHYPDQFIIADAKRGDIGNTSALYARTFFTGEAAVDALTVAPYMGEDSVSPFLQYEGKWTVLLALTSNKGSANFQCRIGTDNFAYGRDTDTAPTTREANCPCGEHLYEQVLKQSQAWGTDRNMMYVVGATQATAFAHIRRIVPNHFLLVPGVGAQGGSLAEVCKYGMTPDCGLLVNSSRAIIYASSGEDYAQAAQDAAQEVQQQMSTLL